MASTPASTGHPAAADLRAAADALIAGRDLVRTHDSAASPAGGDPLWASALNARPVMAALMHQLAGYAPHLVRLTDRLLCPAPKRPIPPATRQALQDTGKWLTLTASAHASEPGQPGLDVSTLLLHNIPANLPPPRHPPANTDLPAAELCAGATATAARLRHLAHRPPGQPDWPPPAHHRHQQPPVLHRRRTRRPRPADRPPGPHRHLDASPRQHRPATSPSRPGRNTG
jgi:hypothetical protein